MPTTELHSTLGATEAAHGYDYLGILDFEATCDENENQTGWDPALQEIIEVPLTLVRVATGEVVDRFETLVRPTEQPRLTEFCTNLTHITQPEVDAAPNIEQVFAVLNCWLDAHGVNASNTLLITCGDWDLRTMWPRQVSLSSTLTTPLLFQHWCNLKVVFSEHTGRRTRSMLEMLQTLALPHYGHHHRGADDVINLTNIVLRLLAGGARFHRTWNTANRASELQRWLAKLKKAQAAVDHHEHALARLPKNTTAAVRRSTEEQLNKARLHAERTERTVRAFQVSSND